VSTAADDAYEGLRAAIREGRYALGSPLSEVQLAQDLKVSRTPVREAMRRLAAEGLIDLNVNRVARVATWTTQDLEDVYDLRALLESHGAQRAAAHIGSEQLALLTQLSDQEEAAVRAADPDRVEHVIRLNARFHTTVVEAAQNPRLRNLVVPLLEIPSVLRSTRQHTEHHLRCNWRDHQTLVEALRHQDGEWAASAMRAHMLGEKARLLAERRDAEAVVDEAAGAVGHA
jgi:DNA-binding GntR family transcriptional regulator